MKQKEQRTVRGRRAKLLSVLAGGLVLAVAAVILIGLGAGDANGAPTEEAAEAAEAAADENEKAPVPVEVAEVVTGPVSAYITATANLVAEHQVRVLAEAEGRVSKIAVEEGDAVARGQVLAMLARDDAEIGWKKADLKETNARLAFERGQELAAKELISREEFDRFTMDYEIARQELAEAEWSLEKTTIRAPFAGRLSERMIQPGQHIRPGDELFQVTDLDPLVARIYLPERDVLSLEAGREVKIRLNAAAEVAFGGAIRQISPVVDVGTGTVKVTIEARQPPAGVRPGSFVTVDIVRETHPEALLLPREAVLRELKTAHVFVVDDDTAEKRAVSLGLEEGGRVEVLSGVAARERVIVAGQGGLRDGSPVKILEPAAPAGAAG